MSENVKVRTLGKTLAGLDMPIIDIISKSKGSNEHTSGFYSQRDINENKKAIK